MTARGGGLLLGGAAAITAGWTQAWPELTALGAGAITLVLLVLLLAGPRPRVGVDVSTSRLHVVRGQRVTVSLRVNGPGRHWMRLVDGPVREPLSSSRLRRWRGSADVPVPVDTSRRGEWPLGPYQAVQADPWAIVRRVAGTSGAGVLTVYPRTVAVRALSLRAAMGDSDRAGRRIGDQHFHALRDYVLGDEPRMVHWRSSARAGKLVVRQQVAATASGTAIVLDADLSAYGSDDQFGSGWTPERFEHAVEVAASLATSRRQSSEVVHVVSTRRGDLVRSAASTVPGVLLDAFATVQAAAPVDVDPAATVRAVRRVRPAQVVVVTGTASPALAAAARQLSAAGISTAVVRVAAAAGVPLPGLRVVDVASADDLA